MIRKILTKINLNRIGTLLCLFFCLFFHANAQNKTINVYDGSSPTVILGNQSNNYYQPTEVLSQIQYQVSKILNKIIFLGKNMDSLKMDDEIRFQKPFLEQLKEDSISNSLNKLIIDSLLTTIKNKDEDLAKAKDLIAQSEAVNRSAKILVETTSLIKVEQDNRNVYSFKESDIRNNQNLISVFYTDDNRTTAVVRKFNRYGFINHSGNLIINYKYEYAENFENKLALVVRGGKYGYIDSKDEIKIPFKYDFALSFRKGKALVSENNKWFFINKHGKRVRTIKINKDSKIESVRYLVNKSRICVHCSKPGYYDYEFLLNRNGRNVWYLIFPRHFYLFDFGSFYKIFEINSATNYVVQDFDKGYRLVNNRLKPISNSNRYDIKPNFDKNKFAIVKDKIISDSTHSKNSYVKHIVSNYNIINTDGIEMLSKTYDCISTLIYGSYPVQVDNKWGLLDSKLIEHVKCEYDSIKPLSEKVTLALKTTKIEKDTSTITIKKYGIIDENGYSFIPLCFDKIEFVEKKYFIVSYNNTLSKLEIVNHAGTIDVKCLSNCDKYYSFIASNK